MLTMALAGAFIAFLRPAPLGGPLSLVIVSGQSMEPTMRTGDLAVVFRHDDYAVGDIVAFRPQTEAGGTSRSMVIHRIVDDGSMGVVTQGDGNDWLDPWTTPDEAIAGRMAFFLPGVGQYLAHLSDPLVLGALSASAAAFLVVSHPRRHKSEEEQAERGAGPWAAQAP